MEVAIAGKILDEMKEIGDNESKDFKYFQNVIKSDKDEIIANNNRGQINTILKNLDEVEQSRMDEVGKLSVEASSYITTPEYQIQLGEIQKDVREFYFNFMSTVYDHCKEIYKFDSEINPNNRVLRPTYESEVIAQPISEQEDSELDY